MKICTAIDSVRAAVRAARNSGKRIGLVPTMGALHEGHLSLVRAAKVASDFAVVSIFVNPTQFGPTEDLAKYPRSYDRDRTLLEEEGADLLFVPNVEEMYATGETTWVTVEGLSEKLDGKSRPGHFRGVATVVAKLFHIVEPDTAYFGQKDAAQLAIIRRMVRDLRFPVKIIGCPIVRDPDGLAMSSRNTYLNTEQRAAALALSRGLRKIEDLYWGGERDAAILISAGKAEISPMPNVRLDYLEVVNPETLDPVPAVTGRSLVAVAAYVGTTRLIDNVILSQDVSGANER